MTIYDIFVYCSGKCGSETLKKTFDKNNYKCLKLHGLTDYNKNYARVNENRSLFELIETSSKNKEKVYIIDSYRTPIERKISSFFQNIDNHLPNYKSLEIVEIIDYFNTNLLRVLEEYHSIHEVFKHYDMTLWSEFDFTKKYNSLQKDNIVVIKLLFKDIQNWDKILSEIFDKNITIYNHNVTTDKSINNLYQEFKHNYRVPKIYIDYLIEKDKEFKIYNTKDEQEEYLNQWLKKSYE
jgi:hypothetical protein